MDSKRSLHLLGTIHPAALALFAILMASELCYPILPAQAANAPSPIRQQSATSEAAIQANFIGTELDSLTGWADDIFNLAQAGNLERAEKRVEKLKKLAAALDHVQDEANLILLPRLKLTISNLEKALSARNHQDIMLNSNRITLIAATLAVPYQPRIPTEVSLLEYNGRELEIWSEAKRMDKLSSIVMRMHLAWQTLMPKLIESNGSKELKRFSLLMRQLELARTPEEYDRLSKQALVITASLKAIFARPFQ